MSNYKFNNGKSDAANLAGLLDTLVESFIGSIALEGRLSRRSDPKNNKTFLVIVFYFSYGIGRMFGMSAEAIDKGLMLHLNKYNDADAICAQMLELCRNPRYSIWESYGVRAVELYLQTSDPISSMTQIVKAYFNAQE